jgi:hypothetical protein
MVRYHAELALPLEIEDPSDFTRPWKMSMSFYRRMEPHAQLFEFQCIALIEKYLYGKLKNPG